jgi:hypothetical protein
MVNEHTTTYTITKYVITTIESPFKYIQKDEIVGYGVVQYYDTEYVDSISQATLFDDMESLLEYVTSSDFCCSEFSVRKVKITTTLGV